MKHFALGNKEDCPFCKQFMENAFDHLKANPECMAAVVKEVINDV